MRRPPSQLSKVSEARPAECEFVDKLYWISAARPPQSHSEAFFFNIDSELVYEPFNDDFGPLNLASTHKYIRELCRLLADERYKNQKLFHYTSTKEDKQANSAFLMGAFMVVVLKMSAELVWEAFSPYHKIFKPFRDASYSDVCTYECTIFHCLAGLEFAQNLGWYNFKEFDNREYEYYEKVENGDLNWVIPSKFIAFMGPIDSQPGQPKRGNAAEDYLEVFKHFGVTHVIRLNEPKYEKQKFIRSGINHTDLFFIDGSTPSDAIVN